MLQEMTRAEGENRDPQQISGSLSSLSLLLTSGSIQPAISAVSMMKS